MRKFIDSNSPNVFSLGKGGIFKGNRSTPAVENNN